MKRILKTTAKVVGWIVGVLVVLLLIVLAEPRMILNTKTLVWAMDKFGASYHPKWSELSLEVRNVNLITKRVLFKARDLRLHEARGALDASFPLIDVDATVEVGLSPAVSVRRLERLVVHSQNIAADETVEPRTKQAQKKKKKKASNIQLIPAPIRHMTVGVLDVKIPSAKVTTSSGTTTAKLDAAFDERGETPLSAQAYLVVPGTSPAVLEHYQADLTLASDLWRLGRITYLDLKAHAKGDRGLAADARAVVKEKGKGRLRLDASAKAAMQGQTLDAELGGDYTQDRASANATLAVAQPKGRFELRKCRFGAPLKKGKPESADLECGLAIVPQAFGRPSSKKPKELLGKLESHTKFGEKDRFDSTLSAELGPDENFHAFHAKLGVALSGRTSKIPQSLKARHKLDVTFTVKRFQDLVSYFDDTEFAIPAPVNAFSGPVSFEARTEGDSRGEDQGVEYRVTTDLKSQKQSFVSEVKGHVDATGLFTNEMKLKDYTDVDLKDVALQTPNITIGKFPSPVVDTRIKTGDPKRDAAAEAKRPETKKSSSTAVDFTARVYTSKPVRIISNLLKEPAPIALDLKAQPAGLSGRIAIQPFNLEVFRQQAKVDHITLTPSPGSGAMGLDGKIVYKRQDVTVSILLLGSTDKPTITFESDPPMTQNEIVALLLYGKSPQELDADQQATAGNATSAFTDGAFGLVSLFLFASTPVDSVGYDAATQTYQVKFKLPGGATLGVGAGTQESKTLSLRKRVARNVELETQLRQTQEQTQRRDAVTTFLQWFRRY